MGDVPGQSHVTAAAVVDRPIAQQPVVSLGWGLEG